jgi:uroporphyrinogen decarboxylase
MSLFVDACFGRPTPRTPVWLMRQAGRYQPSYRALRERVSFLELCKTPELAAEVTVRAARELDADAAIIFSDILVALEAMGAPLELSEAGPRLAPPLRDRAAVEALAVPDPAASLGFVLDAVRLARRELGELPLIGFAGAPLTLASYLVEGGNSKSYTRLKALIYQEPATARLLFDKLARTVLALLRAQVEAGCAAVQLFDSWGGILAPLDYRELVLPYLAQIFAGLADLGVPRILFATCSSTLLELQRESGADVIGVDWRIDLDEARRRLGPRVAVQGNLEPACLFMEEAALEARVALVLEQARAVRGGDGHVFNLGHGILPETRPERARFLVDAVHRLSRRPPTTAGGGSARLRSPRAGSAAV